MQRYYNGTNTIVKSYRIPLQQLYSVTIRVLYRSVILSLHKYYIVRKLRNDSITIPSCLSSYSLLVIWPDKRRQSGLHSCFESLEVCALSPESADRVITESLISRCYREYTGVFGLTRVFPFSSYLSSNPSPPSCPH